jgi:hypothetical protein
MQGNSKESFLLLYGVLSGLLVLVIASMLAVSGRVFEQQKNEDSKDEGSRVLLKALSFLLCMYLFILQIPLTTLLL